MKWRGAEGGSCSGDVTTTMIRNALLSSSNLLKSLTLAIAISYSARVHWDVSSTIITAAESIKDSILALTLSPGETTSPAVTGTKPISSTIGKTRSRYRDKNFKGIAKKHNRL